MKISQNSVAFSEHMNFDSSYEPLIFRAVLVLAILGRLQMPRNLFYVNKSYFFSLFNCLRCISGKDEDNLGLSFHFR